MKKPYEAIVSLLQSHDIAFETIEHEPVFTSEQAAAVRGLSLRAGAKSLLFKTKQGFVLVVLPGNQRVDTKKLKQYLGVKELRFATPEEVVEQMGCEIGACYPFGTVAGLRTLMDETMTREPVISCNPGRHDISIKFAASDFMLLVKPEIVSVV